MQTISTKAKLHSKQDIRSSRNGVLQDKIADVAIAHAQKTQFIWSRSSITGPGLAAIVCALYYLPQSFVIMLPRVAGRKAAIAALITPSIVNQIEYYDQDGSPNGEPSFITDALISQVADDMLSISSPRGADPMIVTPSPEALASALLKTTRTSA